MSVRIDAELATMASMGRPRHEERELDNTYEMILSQVHLRKPCYDFSFL